MCQAPLPPPFNVIWFAFYTLPRMVRRLFLEQVRNEVRVDSTGFKLVPPQQLLSTFQKMEMCVHGIL